MNTLDFLNANKQSSPFVERAQYLKDNWDWLKYSYAIAIKVQSRMEELNMTQKQLAEAMGCTQQHISVLLRGTVNMTLETLSKLEKALNFTLIGSVLEFTSQGASGYLNDPGPDGVHITSGNSALVEGYGCKPRKKKGPKKI